jgi:prepilin-type N-terminal cleavage/methylation domain-containing protein
MKTCSPQAGLTLVEVMISVSLSSVILAAVLSSFLMLGRSGINIGSYNDMEAQARISLEKFGQDVRQAEGIQWTSGTAVTLSYPASKTTNRITYKLEDGQLVREVRAAGGALLEAKAMVTGVTQLSFIGYSVDSVPIAASAPLDQANRETKQLQLSLRAARARATVTTATNTVLSARFILRNKPVTF